MRRVLESLIRGDLGSREGEGVRTDVGESVCVSTMKKFPLRDEVRLLPSYFPISFRGLALILACCVCLAFG